MKLSEDNGDDCFLDENNVADTIATMYISQDENNVIPKFKYATTGM